MKKAELNTMLDNYLADIERHNAIVARLSELHFGEKTRLFDAYDTQSDDLNKAQTAWLAVEPEYWALLGDCFCMGRAMESTRTALKGLIDTSRPIPDMIDLADLMCNDDYLPTCLAKPRSDND